MSSSFCPRLDLTISMEGREGSDGAERSARAEGGRKGGRGRGRDRHAEAFALGRGDVLEGLEKGVRSMRQGEKDRIIV